MKGASGYLAWTFWNMFPFLGKCYYSRYGNFEILQKKKKRGIITNGTVKFPEIFQQCNTMEILFNNTVQIFPIKKIYCDDESIYTTRADIVSILIIDRTKEAEEKVVSLIFIFPHRVFVPDFRGRSMHRHEKFLEHVDAPSPWLDCITIPLCFARRMP